MVDVLPQVFKGIALLTPGGDLIYGIDQHKQTQWHAHLCQELQKTLNLADSPHFLIPGYTATIERWLDPSTHQLVTIAEVYPAVERYIPLLEVLFELESNTKWQIAPWQEEHCNRAVIETYKSNFPQLWQQHNLVLRHDPRVVSSNMAIGENEKIDSKINRIKGYNLRLFISSDNATAEKTLSNIHHLLEAELANPYSLKVIDVAKHPEQAVQHRIITTPTLIRVLPQPVKRIVGQLDDIPRVLSIILS
ncbi:MAG: circadian clock KaiB family protein [Cyanobacteria bacterium J06600_6]